MTDEEMDCKAKITNEASDCADQCCHISCVVTAYRQFDGLPVDWGRTMEKAGRERKTGVVCQGYQAGNTSCASYS